MHRERKETHASNDRLPNFNIYITHEHKTTRAKQSYKVSRNNRTNKATSQNNTAQKIVQRS